jgi:hypothetical protein
VLDASFRRAFIPSGSPVHQEIEDRHAGSDMQLSAYRRSHRGNMPRTPLFSREEVTVIEFKRRDMADTNTRTCCLCGRKIKKSEVGYYAVEIKTKDGRFPEVAHRRCIKEGHC